MNIPTEVLFYDDYLGKEISGLVGGRKGSRSETVPFPLY